MASLCIQGREVLLGGFHLANICATLKNRRFFHIKFLVSLKVQWCFSIPVMLQAMNKIDIYIVVWAIQIYTCLWCVACPFTLKCPPSCDVIDCNVRRDHNLLNYALYTAHPLLCNRCLGNQ